MIKTVLWKLSGFSPGRLLAGLLACLILIIVTPAVAGAATRTISNTGGNWDAPAAWEEGAVPTANDDVVATAYSGDLTINVAAFCGSLDLSSYNPVSTVTHYAYPLAVGNSTGGKLNLSGSWTYTAVSDSSEIKLISTTTGNTVITGGKLLGDVNFDGAGGGWTLQDSFASRSTTSGMTLTQGTLDTNNQVITLGTFTSNNSDTRTLTLGSSKIILTNDTEATAWQLATTTGLTFNAGTSTIILNGLGTSFYGGGLTYNNVSITGAGTGALTFSGSNTFNNFTINAPRTVILTSSTTQTVYGNFTAIGAAGNPININASSAGSVATISKPSGRVNCDYLSLQDVTTTGGPVWYAGVNSSYAPGNVGTGWTFAAVPGVFYSVGQAVADLKTGTPTLSISSGAAVFSTAQTGNIGVGDRVTYGQVSLSSFTNQGGGTVRITTSGNHGFQSYDYVAFTGTTNYNGTYQIMAAGANAFDITHTYVAEPGGVTKYAGNLAYIWSKNSQTNWNLIDPKGGTPSDRGTAVMVNSIKREYTSLNAASAGAGDANHLKTTDLVAANVVLNIPCYYDSGADTGPVSIVGYMTSATNYIKIYTPANTSTEANNSQRHQGKWDDAKYKLVKTTDWANVLFIAVDYVRVVGLQVDATQNNTYGIYLGDGSGKTTSYRLISDNIVRNSSAAPTGRGIQIDANQTVVIANNLIYNFGFAGVRSQIYDAYSKFVIYNNTVINSGRGFSVRPHLSNTEVYLKNNLAQNNVAIDYEQWCTGSSNNISRDATSPDAAYRNKTVSFADVANKDFHLLPTDNVAQNAGADLTADSNFAFSKDLDGQTRNSSWDIGADEGATAVYYSVGQNTNDHKTGTPSMDMASGIATFSTAQTAANLGVGDKVTYNGSTAAYISAKISTTQWKLVTATGAVPANVTGATVNSIAHVFNSLNAAASGARGASYLNSSDLSAGNYQLNIPCYYDTGADTTVATLQNYTAAPANYIKIYTPVNTSTEVNTSQRHKGKSTGTNYLLNPSGNGHGLTISVPYTKVVGLEITDFGQSGYTNSAIIIYNAKYVTLDSNYIHDEVAGNNGAGVSFNNGGIQGGYYFYNNIVVNVPVGFSIDSWSGVKSMVFNNTVINASQKGYTHSNSQAILKNNIAQGCTDGYSAGFNAASNYNISDLVADAPGANSKNSITVSFNDPTNKDYHLSPTDTAARGAGVDLSADANLAFNTDIDGEIRTVPWDIGADNPPPAITITPAVITPTNLSSQLISGTVATGSTVDVVTDTVASDGGATVTGTTWSYNVTDLVEGSNNITVTATNPLTTTATAVATIVYDSTGPSWPGGSSLSTTAVAQTTMTLNWTSAMDNIGIVNYLVYQDGTQLARVANNVNTYEVTALTVNTLYTFRVEAVDVVGNQSATGPSVTEATLPESVTEDPLPETVTGVSLNKTSTTILEGGSETIVATVIPASATNQAVTWSSDNLAVVNVTEGVISAVGEGSAVITVRTLDGGYTATCTVSVTRIRSSHSHVPPPSEPMAVQIKTIVVGPSEPVINRIMADVAPTYWAYDSVNGAVYRGIFTGSPRGFEPERSITRIEFLTVLLNTLDTAKVTGEEVYYKDIATIPDWARGKVQLANTLGLAKGYPDKSFRPNQTITRAEAAVMINQLVEVTKLTAQTTAAYRWSDTLPQWAVDSVNRISALNLVRGYPDGSFRPHKEISRAEVSVILVKLVTANEHMR